MNVKNQKITADLALYNGDCCEVLTQLKNESVDMYLFSPPFSSLYSYSDDDADLGNAKSYEEFFAHFEFVVKEIERTLVPGRIAAVHCMDLPEAKQDHGYIGLREFPDDIIKLFRKNNMIFASRHCIWKDPLIAATRTHALGLAHKQIVKDSSMCRMGLPDYIVAFRKKGDNPKPIKHPMGLTEYAGERQIPRHLQRFVGHEDQKTNSRSHWIWQKYASPIWDDIRQTRVLPYKKAREEDDQRHLCPLQTDTIERCLTLWSNPGDTICSPFAGVGSELFVALEMGRKAIGIELKSSYYKQALRNLESLKTKQKSKSEFQVL